MKLISSSQHHHLLESSNTILSSHHHHHGNDAVVVVTRMMLSSHRDNDVALQPYAPPPGRRAAVLLDHHHHHHRRYRPNVVEVAPSCPRCDSPNTKFCYYNNYSLSQPRYFCKGCRRYWTKGGSLRNVPVGGGCRKSRRGKPVVRAVAVDAAGAAGASGGGAAAAAAFAHRSSASSSSPATLRPDLLLEGMIGGPVGLCQQPTDDDASENPAVVAPEGSTIDLALLYAKFLNQQPATVAAERCAAAVPESLDTSGDDVSPAVVPPRDHQPFTTQDGGFGELSATTASAEPSAAPPRCPDDDACAEALVGAFSVDPRCYDSLGLPPDDGGDLVLPSTWHLRAKYEPFDPLLPEVDAMSLQDGFAGDDEVWSSALACQGLEAALCRP